MLFHAGWVSLWGVSGEGPRGPPYGPQGLGFPSGSFWGRASGPPLGLKASRTPLGLKAWVSHRGVSGYATLKNRSS